MLLSLDPPGSNSSSSGGPSHTPPAILGALSSPQLPPAEEAEEDDEEEIQRDGRPPPIRTAPLLHRTDGPASWSGVMEGIMHVLLFLVPLVSLFLLQVDARHLVPLLP